MQLEHRQVPREMAVERRAGVVLRQPLLEKRGAAVVVEQLEVNVRQVVAGVGVGRVLRERAIGQTPRLLEPIDLVVREGERGLKPPVVAIRGSQALQKRHTLLLAIARAGEADGAARLVDEQSVARELRDVLIDQRQPARRLTCEQRAERLDVLPLASGRPADDVPRLLGRRARRRRVALGHGNHRQPGVCDGQPLVGLDGLGKRLPGARAVREQHVHSVLKARSGLRRRGADRQSVTIGRGHTVDAPFRRGEYTHRREASAGSARRPRCSTFRFAPRGSSPPTSAGRRSELWSCSTSTSRASTSTTAG
jgi:hypothetical protein